MSRLSPFVARAFLWLIGGAFVLGFLYLPLAFLRGLLIATGCFTEVLAEARGVSGFDFEVSETDCWHSPAVNVYVLKPGRSKKTRLFQYTRLRNTDPPAVITSTGEHTVLISLSKASTLGCRRDTWKALTVRYDIGPVKHAGIHAQPPECWDACREIDGFSMSIIRVLRSLLLIALALVALAIGGVAVAAVEVLFLAAVGLWSPYGCTKTVHQRVAGLSGVDFEISEMGCDLLVKDTTMSVFISKAGGTNHPNIDLAGAHHILP